jgi:hypothetical protein
MYVHIKLKTGLEALLRVGHLLIIEDTFIIGDGDNKVSGALEDIEQCVFLPDHMTPSYAQGLIGRARRKNNGNCEC